MNSPYPAKPLKFSEPRKQVYKLILDSDERDNVSAIGQSIFNINWDMTLDRDTTYGIFVESFNLKSDTDHSDSLYMIRLNMNAVNVYDHYKKGHTDILAVVRGETYIASDLQAKTATIFRDIPSLTQCSPLEITLIDTETDELLYLTNDDFFVITLAIIPMD